MKKIVVLLLLFLFCGGAVFADETLPDMKNNSFFSLKLFTGASALIGATDPDFSYGLGARYHWYNKSSIYGFFVDAEWNKRGGSWGESWDLHFLDFNFGVLIGREFFFGAGLSLGIKLAQSDFITSSMSDVDFASMITFGYIFPGEKNRFVLGFDFKVSLVDLYEVSSTSVRRNITWGVTFGFTL